MNTTSQRGHTRASKAAVVPAVLFAIVAALLAAVGVVTTPDRAHAVTTPAIWVGSPVQGTWGVPGDPSTTPGCCPAHHLLYKASPTNDWSVDLSSIPSGTQGVYLYAAPSDSSLNTRVTARVTQIIDDNACRYGGGGDLVTVGLYFDGVLKGRATYAHIARNPGLYVGQSISRWGSWLGNVDRGIRYDPNCWTGPHVHFELRAEREYSCWNKGFRTGYTVGRTNFLGFVSGPTTPGASQRCP